MPSWYKTCQIGRSEQQVQLQHLLHLEFRVQFGFCILVSSLQYQLIGKLLGSGTHPAGELNKIDLIVVCKVGELFLSTSR